MASLSGLVFDIEIRGALAQASLKLQPRVHQKFGGPSSQKIQDEATRRDKGDDTKSFQAQDSISILLFHHNELPAHNRQSHCIAYSRDHDGMIQQLL
jgi:hypothetical protein